MVPKYLKEFISASAQIDDIVKLGTIPMTTGSNGTIQLQRSFSSVSASLMSIPIDDISYSDAQIKNSSNYKISYYSTASNFSVKLDGLNQELF